ncbi:hypothetical protein [Noviherbaspirillum malthae]|jgi:hypothetical protein|uniref:hypothetical protein n=1 Tax=Noviherbaspirillum malthae TaxID=1260987 RepID=UPI001890803C|nr:hypothetical protein [Noviherbaspirillum malthae]
MLKKTLTLAMISSFALALSACDVRKTQEGNVTLPKYEIDKTQQGNLKLPEYDVKTPQVDVRKEEKTVEVPTIKKEERTIEVPNVDVTPARDK